MVAKAGWLGEAAQCPPPELPIKVHFKARRLGSLPPLQVAISILFFSQGLSFLQTPS